MSTHGTRAHYVKEKCRCGPCRNANRVEQAARERAKLYGRYNPFVDAAPVRAHILALSAAGIGRRRLSELSGVSDTAIQTLKTGTAGKRDGRPPARIRRETAERILAVQLDTATLAPGAHVDARGTHRRIQALAARGWSHNRISGELGLASNNVHVWLRQTHVSRGTADAVSRLYDQLWDKPPPAATPYQVGAVNRTINHARRIGWLPPIAWDDIDTDPEPPAVDDDQDLDEIAVERALTGQRVKLNPAERAAAVTRLHRQRWSDNRIATALHVSIPTVRITRQQLGLEAHPAADMVKAGAA